jgi:hypothetical protein
MAQMDEVKELIAFLKAVFITSIVINTSLVAWIFKNYDSVAEMKLYLVASITVILGIGICYLLVKILKEIRKLRDL